MWTIIMVFRVLALDDSHLALPPASTGLSLGLFAFSIFGGVVADRYSKRHIIIITVQGCTTGLPYNFFGALKPSYLASTNRVTLE